MNGTAPVDRLGFDDLERRGWVEVVEDGVRVTDKGRYWLTRWARTQGFAFTSRTRVAVKGAV